MGLRTLINKYNGIIILAALIFVGWAAYTIGKQGDDPFRGIRHLIDPSEVEDYLVDPAEYDRWIQEHEHQDLDGLTPEEIQGLKELEHLTPEELEELRNMTPEEIQAVEELKHLSPEQIEDLKRLSEEDIRELNEWLESDPDLHRVLPGTYL